MTATQPYLSKTISNVGVAFTTACETRGSRSFLVDAVVNLNGDQAAACSDKIAGGLVTFGLSRGAHVAFLSRPSVWHTLAWISVIRCGGIATNLHLLETPERLVETIAWLDAALVIFDREFSGLAQKLRRELPYAQFVELDQLVQSSHRSDVALDSGESSIPIAIVLSSGSTGRPKGVVHTNASVLASIAAGPHVYRGIDSNDSVLVCIGTSFGGWCNLTIPFLGLASRLVFQRKFDPDAFLQTLVDERISIAPLVPTMWRMVIAANPERYDLSGLKLAFLSGEMATRTDIDEIKNRITKRICIAYLSTEGACGSGVIIDEDQFTEPSMTPAGIPIDLANVRVVIPGEINGELAPGEIGEIILSSDSLARGYWKDPTRTAERFVDGWWRSGDTGYRTKEGRIVVVGRIDHVINSGGVKIQAEEIEAELMRNPVIRQAAVVGVSDETWGQRAEAFVIVSDPTIDSKSIETWTRSPGRIASIRFLKAVHIVDSLPTGPTGKLFRPGLIAPRGDRI
jgi:acyl-CoA synthetase (AMP-forming)/AMP-acid ligase II